MSLGAPDSLPLLARGGHRSPADGVCLMEYVSVLAGEPFSDHPRCTHPLVAGLARMVNDTVSDGIRPRLALLAPDLIGATGDDRVVAPELLARAARAALAVRPRARRLQRVANRAGQRRRLPALSRSRDMQTLREAVSVLADHPDRDGLLFRLLSEAVAGCRVRPEAAGRTQAEQDALPSP